MEGFERGSTSVNSDGDPPTVGQIDESTPVKRETFEDSEKKTVSLSRKLLLGF